jgi:catechol 2,3-dioxygenase-like lactoylglutathione lyase family enzyme
MTFQVLGLDHVVLRVRDIEPALGFYRDVLGCSLERSLEDMGLLSTTRRPVPDRSGAG